MKVCIAGGGRVGRYLAQSLLTNHHSVVIIEPIEAQCRMLADSLDIPVICAAIKFTESSSLTAATASQFSTPPCLRMSGSVGSPTRAVPPKE